jgi:hypothetical protein
MRKPSHSATADTKSQTTRVQLELPQKDFERLSRLKEINAASSYAEVLKEALRLYEFLIDCEERNTKFYIKEEDEELTRIKLFT